MMNKKKLLIKIFIFSIIFLSCKKKLSNQYLVNEKLISLKNAKEINEKLISLEKNNIFYYKNNIENNSSKICIASFYTKNIESYAIHTIQNHIEYANFFNYDYFLFREYSNLDIYSPISNRKVQSNWSRLFYFSFLLENYSQGCEWLIHLDADAAFTNFSASILDIINIYAKQDTILMVAKDQSLEQNIDSLGSTWLTYINSGVVFLRNDPKAKDLLTQWKNLIPLFLDYYLKDQPSLIYVIFKFSDYPINNIYDGLDLNSVKMIFNDDGTPKQIMDGVELIPNRAINAFYPPGGWLSHPLITSPKLWQWHPCDFILHAPGTSKEQREKIFELILQNNNFLRKCPKLY